MISLGTVPSRDKVYSAEVIREGLPSNPEYSHSHTLTGLESSGMFLLFRLAIFGNGLRWLNAALGGFSQASSKTTSSRSRSRSLSPCPCGSRYPHAKAPRRHKPQWVAQTQKWFYELGGGGRFLCSATACAAPLLQQYPQVYAT